MRFAELQPHTQFSEAALNSVTQRYIDSHIKHLLYKKDQYGPRNVRKVVEFLTDLQNRFKRDGDPTTFEIAEVLEPYRQDIIKYLSNLFDGVPDSYTPVFQAAILTNSGVHWPEIVEIFEPYREPIIKRILQTVRHGYRDSDVDSWVTALRAIGVDWPEVDIIERSRNASKQIDENSLVADSHRQYMLDNIRDRRFHIIFSQLITYFKPDPVIADALTKNKSVVLQYISDAIKNGYFLGAAKYLVGLQNVGVAWPELENIKTAIKVPCITRMLTILKKSDYDRDHLTNILETIKYLRKAGLDWPELKIINDAAETELDYHPEDEEEEYIATDDDRGDYYRDLY